MTRAKRISKEDVIEEIKTYKSTSTFREPNDQMLYYLNDPDILKLAVEINWPGVELYLTRYRSPFDPHKNTINMKSFSRKEIESLCYIAKYFIQNKDDQASQLSLIALFNDFPIHRINQSNKEQIKLLSEFAKEQENLVALKLLEKSILTENKYCELVEKHLKPLSQAYFNHLNQLLQFDGKEPNYCLTEGEKNAIQNKLDVVKTLYLDLTTDKNSSYKERATNFYNLLDKTQEKIKKHRTPDWERYVSNTVQALTIIFTYVIPIFAVLDIFQAIKGDSKKFYQSHGEHFFNQAQKKHRELKTNIAKEAIPVEEKRSTKTAQDKEPEPDDKKPGKTQ